MKLDKFGDSLKYLQVAPHAGAWIETGQKKNIDGSFKKSLLTQERGLKPNYNIAINIDYNVAPHAGAWIETLWYPKE